ncbi:MAG: manganese transporter [Caldilineae bacterium]|nr:MAG: manganese transporter [Caldilineae bacterium]
MSRPSRTSILFLLLLLLTAALSGCAREEALAQGNQQAGEEPIQVVTTIGMLTDVVRNIGGDHVMVNGLMGPGVDPHLYRASESDVTKLLNADMVFYNGLFLEARMEEIFHQMARNRPAVPVAERAIPVEKRLASTQYADQYDPHVWMDVKLWREVAQVIRDELMAFDPAHADAYQANAEAYLAQLDELEAWAQEQVQTVPAELRVLVTAHDAFHYFGQGYGFEVFAPQGISTASEAGVEDIRRTIDVVVTRDIPAIFVETSVPPDVVEAIVEGARARGHEVVIGGQLFSDAMGEEGTPEGTYIGMIRHNVQTITDALRKSP